MERRKSYARRSFPAGKITQSEHFAARVEKVMLARKITFPKEIYAGISGKKNYAVTGHLRPSTASVTTTISNAVELELQFDRV